MVGAPEAVVRREALRVDLVTSAHRLCRTETKRHRCDSAIGALQQEN
jgi:hypothetical protein